MLRQIREDVAKHYYDPAFHGIDLEARYRDAQVRLQTTAGFNDAISTTLAHVIQDHMTISLANASYADAELARADRARPISPALRAPR